jgi:DNA-binding XRE family transcriptional regulator
MADEEGRGMGRRGPKANLGRRREVAALRAQGLSSAEIGRQLGMIPQLVNYYLRAAGGDYLHPRCVRCGGRVLPDGAHLPTRRPALCPGCVAAAPEARFGDVLHAYRRAAGLTQKALALRCGLAEVTVTKYESGTVRPSPEAVARLAGVLGPGFASGASRLVPAGSERQR